MKKLIVLAMVLAVAGLVFYNFVSTGEFSLIPRTLSEDERELKRLKTELRAARRELAQAGSSLGVTAVDTSSHTVAIAEEIEIMKKQIAELEKKIGAGKK